MMMTIGTIFIILLMILTKTTYYTSLTIFIVMRLKRRAVQSHPTQTPQIPLTLQIHHPMKMKMKIEMKMKINDYYMETKMKRKIIVPSFVIVCMARYYYDTSQNNITSHRIKPINNIIVILLRKLYDWWISCIKVYCYAIIHKFSYYIISYILYFT